jgi:LPS-assembly protein
MNRFVYILIITLFVVTPCALSAAEQPVDLEADQFIYDQGENTITALGNVNVVQGEYQLNADEIIYILNDDFAYAQGNVSMEDGQGDIYYADRIELKDKMRQGIVSDLAATLQDGSRLWASAAVRKSPDIHVLEDAKYTPCKACDNDPDKTPPWSIAASEVKRDAETATISYEDATFEAWGVPIAYIPYFSHPDGTITQKSGFLSPLIGFGSDYGFNAMVPYYWAISPSADMTAGLRVFSDENPQLNLEARKRFENAYLGTEASITYSDMLETLNGNTFNDGKELRGHFRGEALWNINKKWRAGAEVYLASDEQYLDKYDIDDRDVLENTAYVERFDDRDYAKVEVLAFQDLRTDLNVDQPAALPLATLSFMGAPNSFAGGRFNLRGSFLSLYRDGNEQDVNRASTTLAWQRQDILPGGMTSQLDIQLRGDAYYTSDSNLAKVDPNADSDITDTRFIPTVNLELGYPLKKNVSMGQIRIKPMVGITARADIDNDSDIPNEDSQDAQLDASNLFEIDRFPGLDRVEDKAHVNYGFQAGFYGDNGDEFSAFLGQSYRLDDEDNPFLVGSGLETQESDIVGQVNASINNGRHNLNYRFALDGGDLYSKRHEIYGSTKIKQTELSAIYLFEKGQGGTEFTQSREQIRGAITQKINDNWRIQASALYDLGNQSGLRESQLGLSYDDDCYGVSIFVERDLVSDESGADDTTVLARFRLKNLGEFETTAFSSSDDNETVDDTRF